MYLSTTKFLLIHLHSEKGSFNSAQACSPLSLISECASVKCEREKGSFKKAKALQDYKSFCLKSKTVEHNHFLRENLSMITELEQHLAKIIDGLYLFFFFLIILFLIFLPL